MRIKIRKADSLFSLYVRSRDKWTCQRCCAKHEEGSQGLHCSHYFGRSRENTRFDPLNCIALCFGCHNLWGHGDQRDQYKEFMIKRLSQKGFRNLEIRAYQYRKKDDKTILLWLKSLGYS